MKSFLLLLLFSFSASAYPILHLKNPFSGSAFYSANNQEKKTSILMLHGSEGGSANYINVEAAVLATQNYSVLAFCYFDCNQAPNGYKQTLKNIELAKLFEAIQWLRSQPTSNGKVIVYGFSRGAELSLILGSLSEELNIKIDGVIAHAPSDKYVVPYNSNWKNPICWLCVAGVNQCNEQSPPEAYWWNMKCGDYDFNLQSSPNSAWLLNGEAIVAWKRIEIEKYNGPLLITVGEKDEVWPADQTRRIEATLIAAGKKAKIHYFPNAGHSFRGPDEINRKDLVLEFLSNK